MQFVSLLYRFSVAFWAGGIAIFTFVLTPILFRSLPRDQAGNIVGILFPGYFRWGLACGAISLVTLLFLRDRAFVTKLVIILAMLAITSVQAFVIEPRAAALKKEIPSFETTSKDHPLRRQFSKLHGISAVCNLSVFGGGAVLLILL